MKILSGYDDKYKTDYRAKVAEEVEQLRRRADLLREMLLGVSEGETVGQGDVFEVSHPRNPDFSGGRKWQRLSSRIWRCRFDLRDRNCKN